MHTRSSETCRVVLGECRVSLSDICEMARGLSPLLCEAPEFSRRIDKGARILDEAISAGRPIYGVNTGYGDSCTVDVPANVLDELPVHLIHYHGCGLGRYFDEPSATAIVATRLVSLACGFSGVRFEVLRQLHALLHYRIIPLIPEEGSVGASGDLTPLSYVAAVMMGERDVYFDGGVCSASMALDRVGLARLTFKPKEGLALMNGTSVMTALACLAWERAEYLARLATRITAMASLAMDGNRGHFSPGLFAAKPHAGLQQVAEWIYDDLQGGQTDKVTGVQDRYSIRCAPHVIGVVIDALGWMQRDIENELNSANDNPIVDPETGAIYHGGHFYGGHIAFVADCLKTAVANIADLLDRQLALLVDVRFNNGLPRNLSGASGERAHLNHGFKAIQIAVSAWTAEALKLTMPASVFSRSTECHNQDKVSMGSIATRDALRILELTEQVAAACLAAVSQALEIRTRKRSFSAGQPSDAIRMIQSDVLTLCAFVEEDRPLESELRELCAGIRQKRWSLYQRL
ncbi:MAG: HAL/PAL/TAL family ammonia-lyase [Gammaproteobacteria bacterium]